MNSLKTQPKSTQKATPKQRPKNQNAPAPVRKIAPGNEQQVEDALDAGLEESFPASDPLSIQISPPPLPRNEAVA